MRRGTVILALILPFVFVAPVEALIRITLSPRELAINAETIVLAEPLDQPLAPTRFKVLSVLRGGGVKAGDTLTLDDLGPHQLNVWDGGGPLTKPNQCPVVQALLFLKLDHDKRDRPRFLPIDSGLRFLTRDEDVLVPRQLHNPGDYFMFARRDLNWSAIVRQVRADAKEIDDLLARKKLRPVGRRNRALLEWIESRRYEFGAPTDVEHPEKTVQGWDHLETDVFQWVLDTCEPADCWSAVKLHAELNGGTVPSLRGPVFGTRDGRALLLRVAAGDDALEGDRLRALALLSHPLTLWAGSLQRLPQVQFLDAKEQMDLIDRLTPLLASKFAPLRAAAARTLRCASHPEVLPDEHPKSQRALPALVKAFRLEHPGEPRDEIAEAICVLDAKRWRELSGNPPGMVVLLRDLERRGKQVHFWLNLRTCGQVIYEQPTLVLERINQSQAAMETKQMPLPVANLPRPWSEGWDGRSILLVEFSVQDFKDGSWRVSVRGTAGKDKDKSKWISEPKTFVIDPPRKPNNGQPTIGIDW